MDFFPLLVTGDLGPVYLDDGDENVGMQRMADNMAVRTKFFDEFFLPATAAGIHRSVIGVRPGFRERIGGSQPAGAAVYEVDQPEVIEFKTRALAEMGAEPTADRRAVATDLRPTGHRHCARRLRPGPADGVERGRPPRLLAA